MADDAVQTIHLRNEFYRDNYHRIVIIFLISVIVNILLASVIFYDYTHPPRPVYFATSINGRIVPIQPLYRPNQSDSAVMQWATQAAIASYTYNFVDFRQELQAASEFFTAEGWQQFQEALRSSQILATVQAKRLIVSAVATRAPVVLEKGILQGRYSWRVQLPILVTFQSASDITQNRYVITLLVTRVSSLNTPRGIGIAQFVASPVGGGLF